MVLWGDQCPAFESGLLNVFIPWENTFSYTWHFRARGRWARTHNQLQLSLHSSNDSILEYSLVCTLSYFYSHRLCSSKVATPLQQTLLQLPVLAIPYYSIFHCGGGMHRHASNDRHHACSMVVYPNPNSVLLQIAHSLITCCMQLQPATAAPHCIPYMVVCSNQSRLLLVHPPQVQLTIVAVFYQSHAVYEYLAMHSAIIFTFSLPQMF